MPNKERWRGERIARTAYEGSEAKRSEMTTCVDLGAVDMSNDESRRRGAEEEASVVVVGRREDDGHETDEEAKVEGMTAPDFCERRIER